MKKVCLFLFCVLLISGCCTFTPPSERKEVQPISGIETPQGKITANYPSQLPAVIRQENCKDNFVSLALLPAENKETATNIPRISNTWADVDLQTALKDISGQINPQQIIFDESVSGKISFVDVKDATVEETLTQIFLVCPGFTFHKIGNNYLVGSSLPGSLNGINLFETKIFTTNKPAEEIMTLLPEGIDKRFLRANDYQLIVNGPCEVIKIISKILLLIDNPENQIVIEAVICESKKTKGKTIGMEWPEMLGLNIAPELKGGVYTTTVNGNIFPKLHLAAQKGEIDIKVNPRLFVSNGQEAQIEVSKEKYTTLYDNSATALYNTGQYYFPPHFEAKPIKSGVLLKATPQIINDDEIMLTLEIESSEFEQTDNETLPIINKTSAKTKARVKSEDTIIIGGLKHQKQQKIQNGLPDSNALLRKETNEEQSGEITIFITPAILKI